MSTLFLIKTNDYTETTRNLAVTRLMIRILNNHMCNREDAFKSNHSYVPKLANQCSGPNRYLVIEIQLELSRLEKPN
jgi:hypothetical protein